MEPTLGMALCWLLFAGTHIGLASGRLRATLASRLGERGFVALYSLVAAAMFTVLVRFYAAHRLEGPAGLALGNAPWLRGVLMTVVGAGVVLATASLAGYPRSPMALFNRTVRTPYGVERISRHAFFAGVALVAAAHTLLATRLIGVVFMAGLLGLAVVGAWHQDRKLLRLRGAPYAGYLAATSALPFAAIVAGRQRLVRRELPVRSLAAGALVAVALRSVHGAIFDHGGAWVIGATLGGAAFASLQSARAARRTGRKTPGLEAATAARG